MATKLSKIRNQKWYLPNKPVTGPDGSIQWYPVVRVGKHIPFGYVEDPEDNNVLLPIPEELELLEKAKLYLKEYSLRQVAHWLSEESGRYISHVGLKKRVALENHRKRQADIARTYAERYKKASEKAQKLDQRIGGRGSVKLPEDHIFRKYSKFDGHVYYPEDGEDSSDSET